MSERTELLSHLDQQNLPRMVDVADKAVTARTARARCTIEVPESVWSLFADGEIRVKKGPVFQTGIIAGTLAIKKTSELIPFCHPIPIEGCEIKIHMDASHLITVDCRVKCTGKTGVEMEALTGASVAALTIYDMLKAVSLDIHIRDLHLVEKTGGKRDRLSLERPPLYGLILAGGHSKRMQKDKSAINYHGKPQAEFLFELLHRHCLKVFVSCRPEQARAPHLASLPQIHDRYPEGGPLGAIGSAMEAYPQATWMVIACDMPYFREEACEHLVAARDHRQLATAYWNDEKSWPEPLCTIYEAGLAPAVQESLRLGKSCPRKVLMNSLDKVRRVGAPDPRFLANINTREELASLQQCQ